MTKRTDRGVLIYGLNNGLFDYRLMAVKAAERVVKYWGYAASVVTDKAFSHDFVGCIVSEPVSNSDRTYSVIGRTFPFINGNRQHALELSPYEYTVVIDSDFIVSTDQVPEVLDFSTLQVSRDFYSITGDLLPLQLHSFDRAGLQLHLATILGFSKNNAECLEFFELWKQVTVHYSMYACVYGYNPTLYRNDYCVTIALDLLAQKLGSVLPFTLKYSIPTVAFGVSTRSLDPLVLESPTLALVQEYSVTDAHFLNKDNLTPLLEKS